MNELVPAKLSDFPRCELCGMNRTLPEDLADLLVADPFGRMVRV